MALNFVLKKAFIKTIMTHTEDDNHLGKVNPRRENRMLVVQFLYAWEAAKPDDLKVFLKDFFAQQTKPRKYYQFGETLIMGIMAHLKDVDELIQKYAQNWTFNRIAKVDLAILRLAIYELRYRNDIPPIVSINEALDIAGVFSHPDAKRFINGILDKYKETLDRPYRTAS